MPIVSADPAGLRLRLGRIATFSARSWELAVDRLKYSAMPNSDPSVARAGRIVERHGDWPMNEDREQRLLSELMARVRRGDQDAATELVRQYETELRRFVRYRLTDPRVRKLIDSVDVTQSVFANLFVGLAEGRIDVGSPGQLIRLLTTMASNKLYDHHRRAHAAKRDAPGGRTMARWPEATVAASGPSPEDPTESRDFVDAFRSRLGPEGRMLLDWRMEGQGWDEIARQVQASPDAIRKRFSRAIDRVAGEMGLIGE